MEKDHSTKKHYPGVGPGLHSSKNLMVMEPFPSTRNWAECLGWVSTFVLKTVLQSRCYYYGHFYRQGYRGTKQLSNWSKVTHLGSYGAQLWTQTVQLQSPNSLQHCFAQQLTQQGQPGTIKFLSDLLGCFSDGYWTDWIKPFCCWWW